jgi:hypothetical protein
MIAGFVAALGPEGLHTLRRRYEAELAAIPPVSAPPTPSSLTPSPRRRWDHDDTP